MPPIIEADDPQLDAALAQLTSDEAADAAPSPAAAASTTASATTPPPAPVAAKTEGQPSKPDADPGALATKDTAKPGDKPGEKTLEAPQLSKYEKNRQRQENAWERIEAEKTELRTAQTAHKEALAKLEADRKAFEVERTKAAQPKYKPEDYEAYAKACEDKGDFEMADRARARAKELRDNPPKPPVDQAATEAKARADHEAMQKQWWGKAAVDYPSVIKQGTPEHEAMKGLIASEPAILNDPRGMYYGARLVCAETSAARVPNLVKELDAANAKIKEYEGKLNVPGDGSVPIAGQGEQSFAQQNPDQQWSELQREAAGMGMS